MEAPPHGVNANERFKEIECRQCGYKGKPENAGKINPVHGYALRCPNCTKFWGWGGLSKELKSSTGKRTETSIWTAKRLGMESCQCCLRSKQFLGDAGALEVHHVIPVSDGGTDDLSNIWVVCTACHKEIHHRRTYFNSHMAKFFEAYEAYHRREDRGGAL